MNILNWITNLDLAINHWIQENLRNDFLTRFFTFITSLSNYGWFWILLIIVLLINKKTRKVGIIAFVSFCACALVVNVFMKPLFMRTRPYDLVDFLIYIGHKPWKSNQSRNQHKDPAVFFIQLPKTDQSNWKCSWRMTRWKRIIPRFMSYINQKIH